jgi:xylulose-5-phosphate/fructose-6-phosphate phosphoketolase
MAESANRDVGVSGELPPPLTAAELRSIDGWWRAANYLSVGQIYLMDNPLLREPLRLEHIKPRLLGHWGTTPGLNFIYVHLNRVIKARDLDAIYVIGPGHGAPGIVANTYLEGTYTEVYPDITRDADGMRRFFRQFSFPGGIPSHVAAETPGSIHEGGELGYSLVHAYGAAFDNPGLVVFCVVGDGEAETGPLAASWHSNKFLNPARDGAVVPILHLNGWKIANPTVLARIPEDELRSLLEGYGHRPFFVEGDEPSTMHQRMAAVLDEVASEIALIQRDAREGGYQERPRWPMIVLRTPKGWTGPKEVDGVPIEGTFRAHQVPLTDFSKHPDHVRILEEWMHSYRRDEVFSPEGVLLPDIAELAPRGDRRMSANPRANGGRLLRDLKLPNMRDYAVDVAKPGTTFGEATRVLGEYLRDTVRLNPDNFRVMGPDETVSNRLGAVLEATDRAWMADRDPRDDHESPDGRLMEVLSEHLCQGWLEGYLLTGRHGIFNCYEAFVHVVDSMFNQHAKWLAMSEDVPWRAPVSSLNLLITSTVWRQDHNGFTHQDPGFLDLVVNKSPKVTRIYMPPDVNCLLTVADHCLKSTNYINVIVCDKQKHLQFLDMDAATKHCTKGLGIWDWASNDQDGEPDVVMACAGDVPTKEALAAVVLLREHFPKLKIRFINVVDLYKLTPASEHPHGLTDRDFDSLFTLDKPVMFNFHGYPWLIHRLAYRRNNHSNFHVRGYKEKGSINTPLELAIQNQIDRFSLVIDVIDRIPALHVAGAHVKEKMLNMQMECRSYAYENGVDLPEADNWTWPY